MLNLNWRGIDSNSIEGLMICELPPITKPKMRTSITKIDGRDGDIIEELGFESYTKSVQIGLTRNYDMDAIIKYFTGVGDLILSNEPNKIYKARIIEAINFEKLLRFKKAIVKFYVQPFKYLKDEAKIIQNITSQTSIQVTNSGLEVSKPIIKLSGSGIVSISINNNYIFTYSFPENETEVIIDSIEEEAYINATFKNRNMIGSFPKLEVGINTITWSGTLSKIEIVPKSRWL